jgi:hypothetical protein
MRYVYIMFALCVHNVNISKHNVSIMYTLCIRLRKLRDIMYAMYTLCLHYVYIMLTLANIMLA